MPVLRLRRLPAVCMLTALLVPPVAAAPVDEISALLKRGAAKEAYERSRRYPEQLGEPAFDYFYGIAAIDAGHPAEGTLALERYVLTYPKDPSARLELARGYFAMGEDARAKEEFDIALAADPPAEVRAKVDQYLGALKARQAQRRTTLAVFAEAGVGYDSNVNGGVGSPNITLPIGPFTIQDSGVKSDNGYVHAAGGFQITVPLHPRWSAFVGASADAKVHFTQDPFDLRNLSVTGGTTRTRDTDALRLYAFTGNLWLDNNRYRGVTGAGAEWLQAVGTGMVASAGLQVSQLGYAGGNAVRDADLYAVTVGLRRTAAEAPGPTASGALTLGRERNRNTRPDLGRRFYGGRIGLSVTPWHRLSFFGGAFLQRSEYEDADAILGTTRRDWYGAVEAGAAWQWTETISLRLEALISRNGSNLELYEYNRNVLVAKVRYESR
ncbi:MAG: hypothetical protein U1F52_17980 [Burkholderiales bacterium]